MLLYTTTAYPPSFGGAQYYTHGLARFNQTEMPVAVVTHWDSNRSDWLWGTTVNTMTKPLTYSIDGVPVHKIGWSRLDQLQNLALALSYYPLQGFSIDKLAGRICNQLNNITEKASVIHNVRVGREPISYASLMYARQHNIPFVFTPLHHPRWTTWFHRHYLKLYHQADALLALTNYERQFLISIGISEERVFVTGTGPMVSDNPKPNIFRESYNIKGPIILFLGQKYAYKNIRALLDSAPLVWKTVPDAKFVFIGPRTRYSRRLFRSIRDARILEIGRVDNQTKSNALMASDIVCMPSSQESFGSVYVEAWKYNKPVIGGDAPAIQEVIEHGKNGLIAAPKSEEIAHYILQLLGNTTLATQLGLAGKQKLQDQYTWEILSSKTRFVYEYLRNN